MYIRFVEVRLSWVGRLLRLGHGEAIGWIRGCLQRTADDKDEEDDGSCSLRFQSLAK